MYASAMETAWLMTIASALCSTLLESTPSTALTAMETTTMEMTSSTNVMPRSLNLLFTARPRSRWPP